MRNVYIIGIGMGEASTVTPAARSCIESCDCVIGAGRMTESVSLLEKPVFSSYRIEEIKAFMDAHEEHRHIAVLVSGDTGFYSNAGRIAAVLKETYHVRWVPGISSVSYLAAKLGTTWEDAILRSIHGRKQNFIQAVAYHKKTFLLLGGEECGKEFIRKVAEYDLGALTIWVGKSLSYPDEEIFCKKAGELTVEDISGLALLYIENPCPRPGMGGRIPDEALIRGQVPMTKEEVRTVSISKLGLTSSSVLYDIGAGTGSVSVQAALGFPDITIYAVEKNPAGADLIRQNARKFYTDQITVIEGTAPDILMDLTPPTHLFIGGSAGRLTEILNWAHRQNPRVKIVLNAISLETLQEVMEAQALGLLPEAEIVQIQVAKARRLGSYQMMTGQNPVYVISAGMGMEEE